MPTTTITVGQMDLHCTLTAQRYDPVSQEWTVSLSTGVNKVDRLATIKSPFSAAEEADLTWYVEKHALNDPFARKRAKEVSQNLHRYRTSLAGPVESLITRAVTELDVDVPFRAIRLCIEDTAFATSMQSLHWELLEDETAWQTLKTPVLISRLVGARQSSKKQEVASKMYNVLFVSARPTQRDDLPYRLISKPVWGLIQSHQDLKSQISMHFVRPGTWDKTRAMLKAYEKGYFSMVHFDLHGMIHKGRAGLCFSPSSTHQHQRVFVDAPQIASVLAEWGVGTVVLNACDSAKVSSSESSNLAKIFNLHGIDNVVAMSYGFMSHSATIFMNEFYTCFLLKRYDLQRAVFTARLRLRTDSNRLARHATRVEVEDSFVPVLYQTHSSPVFWIEESALVPDTIELSNLDTIPSASEGLQNTQRTGPTILGRDMDMLLLESILEDFKVVSLVGGPGVGKTTFINYLQDWWASSRFAEKIFYFDCQKESDLWTNSAIYEKIANEIPIKPHPHIDRKATIHRAHYIIFLDNLEPPLAQNRSLPGDLSSAQERSFYAFVKEFEKPGKDYHCKLVISSRKAPDMDGQIKLQEVILKPVSIVEAMACAQDILASHDVSLDQGEEASQQLEELLLFHDNNFLFLNIFLPTLKDGTNKLYGFLSTLQIGLPTGVSESLDLNLTSAFKFAPGHSDDQPNVTIAKPNIISSFAYWVMELQDDFPRRYWMLMSLAPFQRRIDLNPKVLLVVLHIRGFISDSNFEALESEIQNTTLLRYYHQEAVEKFFTANPDWIPDWSMMVAQLEAHGLVQLHIHSNPRRAMYMELHPLLPYMIRHEIMYRPSGDGQSVLDQTYTIFREYHELRSRSLLLINPQIDIIFETMMKERINLHNAIALNLQHPQFGCELMMTLSTLINDNLLAATQTEQRAAIEVATKVLARFQQLAASEHGYCTTPNIELSNALLEQTLAVAIYRGRIFALLRDDMEAISNAELALQIFEAAVTQFLPGDNALALKLGLDCVAVQRDFSPERVKSLLEVEPPEQATFVYKAEMESMKQGLQINYMRFQMACGAFNDMKRDVERLKNYPENATLAAVRAAPGVKENTGNLLSLGPKLIQTMSGFNPKDDAAMRALSEELSGLSSDLAQWNPEVRFELERLHGLTHGTAENLNQRRDKMQKAATAAKLGRNHYQEYICHTTLFDLAFEGEDHEAAVLHHQRLLELEQQPQSYKIDETQDSLRRENAIRDFKIGKLLHDAASDVEDPTARNMQYMQSAHHLDLCEDFLRTTPGEVKRLYIFLIMRSVQERDLGKGDDAATVLIFEAVALAYKDPPFIDSPFMAHHSWSHHFPMAVSFRVWCRNGSAQRIRKN